MQEHAMIEKDLSLFYRIFGKGEPVVLIHGFGEHSAIWDGLTDELSKDYKLIIPDLTGSGRSTGKLESLSMDNMAEHINQILKKENIDKCGQQAHMIFVPINTFPGTLNNMVVHDSNIGEKKDEDGTY